MTSRPVLRNWGRNTKNEDYKRKRKWDYGMEGKWKVNSD